MEMRPFDRSTRDPATLKKPRLITEETTPFLRGINSSISNGAGRPLVQRQQPVLGFRSTDKDLESNGAGGVYQRQALPQSQQQQQHQELVNQYRTALAELMFNSKPIITNLTIIAGENVHAAKAVSATICNNIIEVPSDQKLPSLYLLDSIVKNIGRDYIKYFAATLPEVFCKAYKQVDPALHSGMRHLFGTWKGVFPPHTLQRIEKELGFQSTANGSSSGLTISRPDPQPQRPAHSIHVNPKYLEARQRLQHSSVAKGPTSDTNLFNSSEDTERPVRTTPIITSSRPRTDPRFKSIQQAQRDVYSASVLENNGVPYSDLDHGSDLGFGKSGQIVADPGSESSWYGPGTNRTETLSGLRNGSDIKPGFPNLSVLKSTNADVKLQSPNNVASKRDIDVNRSWMNSEEEEYSCDVMNSRPGNFVKSFSSSKRDPRSHPIPEKLGFENRLRKPEGIQDVTSRFDREALLESIFGEHEDSPKSVDAHTLVEMGRPRPATQVASLGSTVVSTHDSISLSASTLKRETDIPSSPPVSSLLSTLVSKGLISASKADSPHELTLKTDPSPKLDIPALHAVPTLTQKSTKIPLMQNDPSVSNSASTEDVKSVIGFEFKPDIIRRSHPTVISELIINDLPHQCQICGLRFKLEERFDRHIEWHTSRNPELNTFNNASRKWFINSNDWVKKKSRTGPVEIDGELMLVADESQCVCVLCGEVFDDFYSREIDKWMFRNATYLVIEEGKTGNISDNHGPMVHVHCISESSLLDLGLSNGVKTENGSNGSR
ncbi:polyadenylation and cleavage factor homolog 4-like isoform X2 [Rutidosis leptorrhynchoides]|uniref:polyadenylation and cleavage factor homolog 4-like isoform X2 n=1 Tax=Rutidosis leptorrhynchoides TaxID=125765 RepID=UPI003A99DD36